MQKVGEFGKLLNFFLVASFQIDNTDAEGRLILADALDYASTFKPTCMLDLATLTGAIDVALGAGATGTFSNSGQLWTGKGNTVFGMSHISVVTYVL